MSVSIVVNIKTLDMASVMLIELPLSRYKFEYQVLDSVSLPNQSGVIWHSVLGNSLKDLVCVVKGEECSRCSFSQQCDYTQLFTGIRPENSEIIRKSNTIPAPHIFQTTLNEQTEYKAGDKLSIDLVLCGDSNKKLLSLVGALYVAGMKGLGKGRSKLRLKQVTQFTGGSQSKSLLSDGQLSETLATQCLPILDTPNIIRLKFLTPYKPSGKAKSDHGIDIGRFLMAVIRRVGLLQYFSTGVKLEADFKSLKALIESVEVFGCELRFL